jgi:hypothetical protein
MELAFSFYESFYFAHKPSKSMLTMAFRSTCQLATLTMVTVSVKLGLCRRQVASPFCVDDLWLDSCGNLSFCG